MDREFWMHEALKLAREAAREGEVPVGCVVVRDGEIVGAGRNACRADHTPTAHAEVLAINAAGRALGRQLLDDCTLFVTMEPCPMCAGAILNARIPTIVYGCRDREMGACGGVFDLFMEHFPHRPAVYGGVLEAECAKVLSDFFRVRREENKAQRDK